MCKVWAARRRAKHQREGRLGITSKGSMKRAATIRELRAFIDRVGCQCPACGLLMSRGLYPSAREARMHGLTSDRCAGDAMG